jgi:hypothetical protein
LNKLRYLSKLPLSSDAANANAAVAQVEKELQQKNPDVRVIDEDGHVINFQTVLSGSLPDATEDDDGWELVELTRRASDLNKRSDNTKAHAVSPTITAASKAPVESIALVSDDTSVMNLAEKAGLYVIASELIRFARIDSQAESNVATGTVSDLLSHSQTDENP